MITPIPTPYKHLNTIYEIEFEEKEHFFSSPGNRHALILQAGKMQASTMKLDRTYLIIVHFAEDARKGTDKQRSEILNKGSEAARDMIRRFCEKKGLIYRHEDLTHPALQVVADLPSNEDTKTDLTDGYRVKPFVLMDSDEKAAFLAAHGYKINEKGELTEIETE